MFTTLGVFFKTHTHIYCQSTISSCYYLPHAVITNLEAIANSDSNMTPQYLLIRFLPHQCAFGGFKIINVTIHWPQMDKCISTNTFKYCQVIFDIECRTCSLVHRFARYRTQQNFRAAALRNEEPPLAHDLPPLTPHTNHFLQTGATLRHVPTPTSPIAIDLYIFAKYIKTQSRRCHCNQYWRH